MLHGDLDESQYVTLLLVDIHLSDGILSYSNAGHVPGFILSRSGEVNAVLAGTGIPLGILGEHRTGTKLVPLQSGQTIILMTDGLIENGEPEQFGTERVLELCAVTKTSLPSRSQMVCMRQHEYMPATGRKRMTFQS